MSDWIDEKDIDYWFSTEDGTHIPVKKCQTKEDALDDFIIAHGGDINSLSATGVL